MNNPQNDLQTNNHHKSSKLPKQFYQGFCELLMELDIDGDDFINDFTRYYVECAANKFKSKTDIYNATGFSEYTARKHLGDTEYKVCSKRKLYYSILINYIKEMCEKSKDGCIPIRGKHKSYVAAFDDAHATDNTITGPSVLKKLIKAGVVEKIDEKNIKFITSLQTKGLSNKSDILKLLANLINRISGTVLHNLLAKNNEEALFQMSYFSNAVHPDKKRELSDKLREEKRKDYRRYQNIIDSYEEKGSLRKWVESLNQEIGVTSLIFKTQMR